MPIIEPLSKDEITSEKLTKYIELAEELQTPGTEFLQVLAHAPNYAESFFVVMTKALLEGNVETKLKEIIRIQLARKAGDKYFASLRSKKAQEEGLTEQLIEAGCTEGFADDDRFTEAEKWALGYGYWMYRTPEALDKAIDSDPISAFGGIVGLNGKCCLKTVQTLFAKLNFLEIVVAPDFDEDAVAELSKKKNLRILKIQKSKSEGPEFQMKHTQLGALLQDKDSAIRLSVNDAKKNWKVATKTAPEEGDWGELLFAWKCAKLVKSNAIVLTQNRGTVGIGAGQMSRVDSVNISCQKAGDKTKGSFLGSDAFFPMPDNIEIVAKHGIKAIVQPGGSIKDEDVIKACDEHGIAMVLTGERHFRH